MRIGAAHRELAHTRDEVYLALVYGLVSGLLWLKSFCSSALSPGGHVWYKVRKAFWWLGNIAHQTQRDISSRNAYIIRFHDDAGPIKLDHLPASYTTCPDAVSGS